MAETVIENYTTNTTVEVVNSDVNIENVAGSTSVLEVPTSSTRDVLNNVIAEAVVEVPNSANISLETTDGSVIEITAATGLTGRAPELYSGAAPPSELVGAPGDLYLVNTGATIGDLYQKTVGGWGTSRGNLRGGIASVNGISGTNITIGANNITTGTLPLAQIPTGTTGTTVALGNHNHSGVYEPVIASGLTTQFWRGDKTWQILDKTSLGLNNVPNVDATNASNISTGTLALARIPTGTSGTTVALGNHNHDAAYVGLTGAQNVAGIKTFVDQTVVQGGASPLLVKGGGSNAVAIGLYRDSGNPNTRSGYLGYLAVGTNHFSVVNEISNGHLLLQTTGGGQIQMTAPVVSVSAQLTTSTLRVGTSTTAGYVLTADASGNASWQQTANIITPGTTAQYYRGDLSWQTLDKAAVGLGNVTNDPQVTLNTAQTISGQKTFSGEVLLTASGRVLRIGTRASIYDVGLDNWLAVSGVTNANAGGIRFGASATNFKISATDNVGVMDGSISVTGTISGDGSGLTALPAAALTGNIAIGRLPTGTTATTVALGNHAHTGVYEPVIASGLTTQYYRGDKSWQPLNAAAVGLGNVANVVQVDLTSGQTITGAKVFNNASNVFTGNGAALTSLNASQLTTGVAPQARIIPNTQRFVFTTGNEARPTGTTYVEWVGPVTPVNAANEDTWTDTSVGVVEDPVVGMPIGTIQMFAASSAPTNWLTCAGQAISRTTYATLYALIGTQYGFGDGLTTFNLPDLRGRMPVGYHTGNTKFDAMGEKGGQETVTLTVAQIPPHDHTYSPGANITTASPAPGSGVIGQTNTSNTSLTGGGGSHENMPPYITVNFIIKVL